MLSMTARGWAWLTADPIPDSAPPADTYPVESPLGQGLAGDDSSNGTAGPSMSPIVKRRQRSRPIPLAEMGSTRCCKGLDCLRRFKEDPKYDARLLAAEQDKLASFTRERHRKDFAKSRVPIIKPERGSMLAGGVVVCARFFSACFGISNNLMSSVKGCPRAPASSSATRDGARPIYPGLLHRPSSKRNANVFFRKPRGGHDT
ncbi:unnamed protein product [Pylaiella littoralis]